MKARQNIISVKQYLRAILEQKTTRKQNMADKK